MIINYWKSFFYQRKAFNFFTWQILSIFLDKTCIFFKFFWKFLSVFRFLQTQEPRNLPYGLKIGYCIVSKCNGKLFKILTSQVLAFFWQNVQIFQFFGHLFFMIHVFPDAKARTHSYNLDNKLLKKIFYQRKAFIFFTWQILSIFLDKTCIFFKFFWKFLSVFRFLQTQEPRNLPYGLKIGYCIVSKCNGKLFKILTSQVLAFFWQNVQIFHFFGNLLFIILVFPGTRARKRF